MIILAIGPPNSGKRRFATDLNKVVKLTTTPKTNEFISSMGLNNASGELSDYRTELLLGSTRASQMVSWRDEEPLYMVNSILDTLAHATTRLSIKNKLNMVTESWIFATMSLMFMMRDSLKYDIAIRFPFVGDAEENSFAAGVDEALSVLIDDLEIDVYEPDIELVKEKIDELKQRSDIT